MATLLSFGIEALYRGLSGQGASLFSDSGWGAMTARNAVPFSDLIPCGSIGRQSAGYGKQPNWQLLILMFNLLAISPTCLGLTLSSLATLNATAQGSRLSTRHAFNSSSSRLSIPPLFADCSCSVITSPTVFQGVFVTQP